MKRIELYRILREEGLLNLVISAGCLRPEIVEKLLWLDFYEQAYAAGNKRARSATIARFVLDEARFDWWKFHLNQEIVEKDYVAIFSHRTEIFYNH